MVVGQPLIRSAALVLLGAAASFAHADVAFSPVGTVQTAGTGNDALFFTVGASNIQVTALGEFNGVAMDHTVGIFNASAGAAVGPALITATVTTDASASGWSYADVSSYGVELLANAQYVLVGFSAGGVQYTANPEDSGIGSAIASFDGYRYNEAASFDATGFGPEYRPTYYGPNFQYLVPTPGSLALLGLGGLVAGKRRR